MLISSPTEKKRIAFRSGVPVHIQSDSAQESLARFLVQRGELTDDIADKAAAVAEQNKRNVGEVLVQMGAVEPHDLFTALKRHLGKQILSVFSWEQGHSQFDSNELNLDQMLMIKVMPSPLILRGVCSFTDIGVIQRDYSGELDVPHRICPSAKKSIGTLHLNTKESKVANALTRPKSLLQLCEEVGVEQDLVFRVIYALSILDMIEPYRESSEVGTTSRITVLPRAKTISPPRSQPTKRASTSAPDHRGSADSEATAKSTASTPVSRPRRASSETEIVVNFGSSKPKRAPTESFLMSDGSADEVVRPLSRDEKNQIDAAYLIAKSGDYLRLLGVDEGFSFTVLKTAFLQKCHIFSPMAYPEQDLGEQADRLEELFLVLVRAFSILAVPSTRSEYIKSRSKASTPSAPKEPSPDTKPTNAYAVSEPQGANGSVKTAVALLNLGEAPEAALTLHAAYQSNNKDAYTCAFLGYALYLSDPVSKLKDAIRLLRKATSLSPELCYPLILLGRVFDFQQDYQGALRAFQDCLALEPDNTEACDAVARLQKFS